MFFGLIFNKENTSKSRRSNYNKQNKDMVKENEDIKLLKLKYEKLHYIQEVEKERDKTVENKASMFIGSTSIMGAIIIGCANLVTDKDNVYSFVNICILLFMLILIYYLGCSIIQSVLTLRKRLYYQLGINDLENRRNIKEHYVKLIESTIKIIKHNEEIINSKVDSMQKAQECFIDFWIWTVLFFINMVAYHVLHAYEISLSIDTPFKLVVTFVISGIGYLAGKRIVEKIREADKDDQKEPDVDEEIRAVCMMAVSGDGRDAAEE